MPGPSCVSWWRRILAGDGVVERWWAGDWQDGQRCAVTEDLLFSALHVNLKCALGHDDVSSSILQFPLSPLDTRPGFGLGILTDSADCWTQEAGNTTVLHDIQKRVFPLAWIRRHC